MQISLKRTVLGVMLALIVMITFQPKKAEAGVLILGSALVHAGITDSTISGAAGMLLGMTISLPFILSGMVALGTGGAPIAGPILLILGEDELLSSSELEDALSQKYPFINDREVTYDLAQAILKKADQVKEKDGKKEVKFSQKEIFSILAPTDLMETHPHEVEKMMAELN